MSPLENAYQICSLLNCFWFSLIFVFVIFSCACISSRIHYTLNCQISNFTLAIISNFFLPKKLKKKKRIDFSAFEFRATKVISLKFLSFSLSLSVCGQYVLYFSMHKNKLPFRSLQNVHTSIRMRRFMAVTYF